MQRKKRWAFDQLADAAEQQPRHGDAEQDYRPANRIFQIARWYSALETRAGARRYPWKNVVFLQSGKRF